MDKITNYEFILKYFFISTKIKRLSKINRYWSLIKGIVLSIGFVLRAKLRRMKIWGRWGKVDIIFSVFPPASPRKCNLPRGRDLKNVDKLKPDPDYKVIRVWMKINTHQVASQFWSRQFSLWMLLSHFSNLESTLFIIVQKNLPLPVFYQSGVLSKRACRTRDICFYNGLDHLNNKIEAIS